MTTTGSTSTTAAAPAPSLRERVLDLVFLVGVVVKGVDGLVEFLGGAILLFVTPGQILGVTQSVFAHELAEDPDDPIANAVLHGVAHLDSGATAFLAAYLLVHGVVKLAVVIALLLGSRRIYPWAIVVLVLFLIYQLYELITAPGVGVIILTALDAVIIWLTWREWRHGRTLHETARGTFDWLLRRERAESTHVRQTAHNVRIAAHSDDSGRPARNSSSRDDR
ncbi:hypothetical protein GCM10022286_16900 [Gryllotalpicola daejeonensis]|uniref:DUF2127 domain-containing protein n=1 Tax=Gryllotalpicola daejeonensis TaxID=993087 RepID=A0ABP7ZJR7_9MICO